MPSDSMICRMPKKVGDSMAMTRSEEHTSELQSQSNLVCRLLLEKKKEQKCYRSGERDQQTCLTTFGKIHQHHCQLPRDNRVCQVKAYTSRHKDLYIPVKK